MSLRLKINLIVASLLGLLVSIMIWLQVQSLRDSVREEIQSANRVTVQLLNRLTWVYATYGHADLLKFLDNLGRVRANEITFTDTQGKVIYRSPPFTYKQGREAPAWFTALIVPPNSHHEINTPTGQLTVDSESSRAVLDGWDELVQLAWMGAGFLLLVCALVYWAVGQLLRPLSQIVDGLNRLQGGDFQARLPALPGREAGMMGEAFNRLTDVLQENINSQRKVIEAETRLSDSRELANLIETHIEAERREIATTLHDEFGQSLTAISSMSMALAKREEDPASEVGRVSRLISEEAGRLITHMHGLIPKLAPVALDNLGLEEAFHEMVERVQLSHPQQRIELQASGLRSDIPKAVALAACRVVQEGMTNALRHGGGQHIRIRVSCEADALQVSVQDNGAGPPVDWHKPGHFGLRWLEDRAKAMGGQLQLLAAPEGGAILQARLPLAPSQNGDQP